MKTILLAISSLLLTAAAFAQREVAPQDFVQPTSKDIVIAGNTQAKDLTCHDGGGVYVEGQRNEVQVHGSCSVVRIQGERNYVWIDHETYVPVEGNDNTVFVTDTKTRYSSRGNGNRFEKAKH